MAKAFKVFAVEDIAQSGLHGIADIDAAAVRGHTYIDVQINCGISKNRIVEFSSA